MDVKVKEATNIEEELKGMFSLNSGRDQEWWDGRLLQCGIVKYKAKLFKEIYPIGGGEEQEIAQTQEMGQAKRCRESRYQLDCGV